MVSKRSRGLLANFVEIPEKYLDRKYFQGALVKGFFDDQDLKEAK